MSNKYVKLLLGVYILKRLGLRNSHEVSEVSESKKSGAVRKYGKLILGAYLMKKLGVSRYYGTGERGSTGGLLNRYAKLMLTTYAVKRLRSRKSRKETEQPEEYMEPSTSHCSFLRHKVKKIGKWVLGAYLLKRFHHREPEAEIEEIVETETQEEDEGTSMIKLNKVVVGALAGITAIYAIKKYRAKHSGYKIDVE